jgi:hypothetical protein
MLAAFAGLFLSSLHFSSPVENFHPVHDPAILKSIGNYMCAGQPGFSRKECLEDFRKHGLVWSAGVNGHGQQEVIVFGGIFGPAREAEIMISLFDAATNGNRCSVGATWTSRSRSLAWNPGRPCV